MVAHGTWDAQLREACEDGTPVAVLSGNVNDQYFVDLEVGVQFLKPAITRTCKGKKVVFCCASKGVTFADEEAEEIFKRTCGAKGMEAVTASAEGAQPTDSKGRRLLNQIRAARQPDGFPDLGETLCRVGTALRQPGFAVVILRAENFLADQANCRAAKDLFESWCTDPTSVAAGSIVIIVAANIDSLPASMICPQSGRIAVIEIPLPGADEFSWILHWLNMKNDGKPVAREDDIPKTARRAAGASLMLTAFLKIVTNCRRRGEHVSPTAMKLDRGRTGLDSLSGKDVLDLRGQLDEQVVGQDAAKAAICDALKRARAGVADPDRPLGNFLLIGPTGVGKTELAKALARLLCGSENRLVRLDMSEYMEEHSVARVIGSPPGYVGHEEGGQLTRRVAQEHFCIVLLDEIEKAHPRVWNILLQIMDDGRLTDGQGRTVDFRQTIVLMTSNAGTAEARDAPDEVKNGVYADAVKRIFSPEFLNRIDEIIIFKPLDADALRRIAGIHLGRLVARLDENRGMILNIGDDVVEHVAETGTDLEYGGRPIRRAVDKELGNQLADLILSQNPPPGTSITTAMDGMTAKFTTELPLGGEKEEKKGIEGHTDPREKAN